MHSRPFALAALAIIAALPAQSQPGDSDALFGIDKMWDVQITMEKDAWRSLYPQRRRGFSRGSRFTYVKANVKLAGHELADVGLRFKGQSTWSYSGGSMKRSLKLDFDRFVPDRKFLGMKKLNLNNNVTDPTQIREAVTYRVYREAGVPASRTAFSRVFLTVPGEFENTYLGMYTIIEQFDKRLLRRWFGSKKGLLVKPRTVLGYYGDTWSSRYDSSYDPKTEVTEEYAEPLLELAKLNRADDAAFAAGLEKVMDVDQFLTYLAVTVITANMDSPLNLSHNFYLAVPKRGKRVVWIPWDLNLSLGGWGRAGPNQDRLSLVEPSRNRFVQRVFDVGTNEDRYRDHVARLIRGCCAARSILAHVATARGTTREALTQESERDERVTNVPGERRPRDLSRFGGKMTLDDFISKREASVLAQLAGKSQGVPGSTSYGRMSSRTNNTSGSGTQTSATRVRSFLSTANLPADQDLFDLDAIEVAAGQVFRDLDTDGSASVDADELSAYLSAGDEKGDEDVPAYLRRRRARHARKIVGDVDRDKDRLLSESEFRDATRKWFPSWDRDKNGKLTRRELRGRGGVR